MRNIKRQKRLQNTIYYYEVTKLFSTVKLCLNSTMSCTAYSTYLKLY